MPKFSLSQLPSPESFINQVPDEKYFLDQLPSENDFLADATKDYDIPGIDIMGSSGISEDAITSMVIEKLDIPEVNKFKSFNMPDNALDYAMKAKDIAGGNIDIPVISELSEKVDEVKEGIKDAAIDKIREKASKLGITIPEIPTAEDVMNSVINMDEDQIFEIKNRVDAVRGFANKYGFEIPNMPDDGSLETAKDLIKKVQNIKSSNDMTDMTNLFEEKQSDISNLMNTYGIELDSNMTNLLSGFSPNENAVDLMKNNSEIENLEKQYGIDISGNINDSMANIGTNFDNPAEEADISIEELLRQSGVQLDPDLKKIMEGYNI